MSKQTERFRKRVDIGAWMNTPQSRIDKNIRENMPLKVGFSPCPTKACPHCAKPVSISKNTIMYVCGGCGKIVEIQKKLYADTKYDITKTLNRTHPDSL